MTISLKHAFTSAKSDGADATLVRPSNWNAEHTLTLATDRLLGRQTSGSGAVEEITCTSAGRAILDDADAATQRTTLGVGTGDSPQFTAVNVGHASDTTVARASAGDISVEGNIVYRAGGTDVPVTDGGTGSSTASGARTNLGLVIGTDVRAATVSTRQVLTSGSGATYTTPAGCRQIRVKMIGAGGGGAASSTNNGSTGGTTTFNSVTVIGGAGGQSNSVGGAGGSGGSGSGDFRLSGSAGGGAALLNATGVGGVGGAGIFGQGAGRGGAANLAGSNGVVGGGGGGGGAAGSSLSGSAGGGGGGGEYAEMTINSPSASYTYTVGSGGSGGSAGGFAGGTGGGGVIIVEEYY